MGVGLDFNPTFFAHPKAADGFTLAHADPGIREFWIEHGIACRRIGAAIGEALGSPCVTNVWIPDGYKDTPVDRRGPRERLARVARRDLRRADRSRAQSRRRRVQALRHRLRELRRRLARVLPGLRDRASGAALPGRRPFPPHRSDRRQDLGGDVHVSRAAAARQPRRALGQRSRRDAHRRAGGHRAASWSAAITSTAPTSASTSSTPASTASPPGPSAPEPRVKRFYIHCLTLPVY